MIVRRMKLVFCLPSVACLLLAFMASAKADVLSANLRGAVRPAGTGIGSPGVAQNYSVGGPSNFKNFFSYDLGTISNQWAITGSQVQAEHSTNNNNAAGTFLIWEVNESVAAYSVALWNDIGANAAYGSVAVANAGIGFANVDLNAAGLISLNAALGDSTAFVVGGTTISSMFNGSSSFRTRIDIMLTANTAPTATTGDYMNFLGDSITLDGTGSDDVDITPFGDSLTYSWMVNGMNAGSTSSSMLTLTGMQLASLGVTSSGDYAVNLTVSDEWGLTGSANGILVSVPEPSTLAILCLGFVGFAARRRRS